ncbi:hypothetical protein ES703_18021 [subsurface metagenome]
MSETETNAQNKRPKVKAVWKLTVLCKKEV